MEDDCEEIVKEKKPNLLLSGDEEIQSVEQLGGMIIKTIWLKHPNQYIVKFSIKVRIN